MTLSFQHLPDTSEPGILPPPNIADLPEKVLQFGTGVLLRGLPDYFIDKANRQGIFNGRIVVVKSTGTGSASAFDDQDGLFTHVVRGIENGEKVDEVFINSSISRVLSASGQWAEILACARNPQLRIVLSNTTEVGIQLDETDTVDAQPPRSFPGKLLAFLHERFHACEGDPDGGLVIVPTELIIDNGKKLAAIVNELAQRNGLSSEFMTWLNGANTFCSSLVDRIVPGKPDAAVISEMEGRLGYTDSLLIVSEVYRLWAIEGDEKVRDVLSFAQADKGVIIAPDIEIFRELKLRLLNGTHTVSCGVAFLAGFDIVKKAMDDPAMSGFVSSLMKDEIAPAIPYEISEQETTAFANAVLDRFRNPHIDHQWLAITAQFTAKLKMRVVPVLLNHYKSSSEIPEHIALGFAAWLLFMRATRTEGGSYYGTANGAEYLITDDAAPFLHKQWEAFGPDGVTRETLKVTELWNADLSALPGFAGAVGDKLGHLLAEGARATLKKFTSAII